MGKFRVTAPDGKAYVVTAPDGASQDEVMAYVQKQALAPAAESAPAEAAATPAPEPEATPWIPYDQQEPFQIPGKAEWFVKRKDGSPMVTQVPQGQGHSGTWGQVPQTLDNMARSFADYASFGQANKGEAALDTMLNDDSYDENLAHEKLKSEGIGPVTRQTMGMLGLIASPVNKLFSLGAAKAIPEIGGKIGDLATRYGRYAMQGGLLNTLYGATLGNEEDAAKSAAATAGVGAMGMVAPPEGGGLPGVVEKAAADFGKGAAFGAGGSAAIEAGPAVLKTLAAPLLKRLNPEEAFFAGLARAGDRAGLTPEMMAAKETKLGEPGMLANIGGQVTDYARDIAGFPGKARQAAQTGFARQAGSPLATRGGAVGRVEGALNQNLTTEEAQATVDSLVDMRSRTSGPIWREMFSTPRVPRSNQLDILAENPEVRGGINGGLKTVRNDANALGIRTSDADYFVDGQPTFQAWHAGKEKLDDILFSGSEEVVHPLTGQLTKYGRSIRNVRNSLLEELQLQFPEYTEALSTWSGPTQSMRMVELGQRVARGDARVTRELVSDITEGERDFLRIGYTDQMKYLASKVKNGANISKTLFGDQNSLRNAEMIFRNRDEFNHFRSQLARETKFHTSKQTVLGGSQTAPRLAGMEDAAGDIGQVVVDGATHGTAGAAANLATKGMKWLRSEPEAVRDVGAQYLFTTDAAKKAYALEQLRKIHNSGNAFGPMPSGLPRNLLGASPMPLNLLSP